MKASWCYLGFSNQLVWLYDLLSKSGTTSWSQNFTHFFLSLRFFESGALFSLTKVVDAEDRTTKRDTFDQSAVIISERSEKPAEKIRIDEYDQSRDEDDEIRITPSDSLRKVKIAKF